MLRRFFASLDGTTALLASPAARQHRAHHARRPDRPEYRRVATLFALTAAAGLAVTAFAPTQAAATAFSGSGCAQVNIIVARASTEAQGQGITGKLASQVQTSSAQTVSTEAVVYPATLNNYASSESQGVQNAEQELATAVGSCPNQKQVLMGYSQGANVVLDVVTGNAEVRPSTVVGPASSTNLSHVVAIVGFGDPGNIVKQAWDLGTDTTTNGIFPRSSTQLQALTNFGAGASTRSWCDSGDPFCASGNNLNTHLTYLNRYQNNAASFVLGRIGG
jgi:acetylxylan esterase